MIEDKDDDDNDKEPMELNALIAEYGCDLDLTPWVKTYKSNYDVTLLSEILCG